MANIEGIGDEWEDNLEVREHTCATGIVTNRPVGMKWCEPNRPNCVANALVLTPLLERMRDEEGYKLPALDDLKRQISILYHRLGASPSEKVIYTSAVEIKKLCSFVKRRTNRLEVTKDWMNILLNKKMFNSFVFDMVFKGFMFFWCNQIGGFQLIPYIDQYRIKITQMHHHFNFIDISTLPGGHQVPPADLDPQSGCQGPRSCPKEFDKQKYIRYIYFNHLFSESCFGVLDHLLD